MTADATKRATTRSEALFAAAQQVIPGGVNSPVRAFRSVGGTPRFMDHGAGPYLWDADGNRYVDYVLSWGPLILGHAPPVVVEAITRQAARGTSFGAPTDLETELAEMICAALPSMEQVRFVSSGTEATMSALRLARAVTGRNRIVKFAGCYHGHADALLVQAGSAVATLGLPDSPGVPPGATADTLTAPYNDLAAVESLFSQYPDTIAAVIVEPVAGNMGLVPPQPGYLTGLRDLTTRYNALLIFDEVMTGFRVAYGGAQALYGITPDLTCLGKVIGGGLPVAAYGGRRELLQWVAPAGKMYQAGTLSGNPLAMVAGLATLRAIGRPGVYEQLGAMATALVDSVRAEAARVGIPVQATAVGSMWGCFFTATPVTNYAGARHADTTRYARFFHALLEAGVYMAPAQFEAAFVATVHDTTTLRLTQDALAAAFNQIS